MRYQVEVFAGNGGDWQTLILRDGKWVVFKSELSASQAQLWAEAIESLPGNRPARFVHPGDDGYVGNDVVRS